MAKRKRQKKKSEIRRFTEYMISGGAYFWSGYLVFFFIDKGLGMAFFWAKSLATLTGWTVNFLLQRYWVFKNPALAKNQTEVTSRYILITLVNFVLDYLIVYGLKLVGISPYIGQFISSGFFTFWNYAWYKFWVFPEKFKKTERVRKVKQGPARVLAHHAQGPSAYRVVKK